MLVASIATIGAAPLSIQQQGTERTPGPSITSGNIVDGEVTNEDLADNAVTTDKIQDGQVTTDDLANDAVTSDKIADGEVTSDDVADGTITSTDIAPGTIPPSGGGGTPDDDSVTSAKIVDGEVKSVDIGDGEVTTQDLANGAVTHETLASGAIQIVIDTVVSPPINVSPLTQGFTSAACPTGTFLTGGGFQTPASDANVIRSVPAGNQWTVGVYNPSSSNIPLQAVAECAHLTI